MQPIDNSNKLSELDNQLLGAKTNTATEPAVTAPQCYIVWLVNGCRYSEALKHSDHESTVLQELEKFRKFDSSYIYPSEWASSTERADRFLSREDHQYAILKIVSINNRDDLTKIISNIESDLKKRKLFEGDCQPHPDSLFPKFRRYENNFITTTTKPGENGGAYVVVSGPHVIEGFVSNP